MKKKKVFKNTHDFPKKNTNKFNPPEYESGYKKIWDGTSGQFVRASIKVMKNNGTV